MSSDGSDQLQSPDGCPAGEGLITPTAGLDRGRRTSVNSVVSARAASCGELGQVRFGSIPSWATGGERIILRSCPCDRDRAPRFLWSETLVKSLTVQSLSPLDETRQKRACKTPPGKLPPNRSLKLHNEAPERRRPATATTGRRSGAAEAPAFAALSACRRARSFASWSARPAAKSRSGYVSGGSVMPCSSSRASSTVNSRSWVASHSRPPPRLGCAAFSSRHSTTRGQASPNTSASSSAGSRVTRSGNSRRSEGLPCGFPAAPAVA